jgi:hypothetical protein
MPEPQCFPDKGKIYRVLWDGNPAAPARLAARYESLLKRRGRACWWAAAGVSARRQ